MSLGKTIICYYGVKGHVKGLVDTMSGFGLKTPLRMAIVTENIFYDTAEKVHEYFQNKMKDDDCKIYKLIENIKESDDHDLMEIKGSRRIHMIAYFPSAEVQVKEEICSCESCLTGNFVQCKDKLTGAKGKIYAKGNEEYDSSEDSSESHDENDDKSAALSDMEENELFTHT